MQVCLRILAWMCDEIRVEAYTAAVFKLNYEIRIVFLTSTCFINNEIG